jgi:hypothetical protein
MNNNRIGATPMASIRISKTVLSAAAGMMALAFIGSVAQAAPVAGALPVLKAEAATNSQVEQVRSGFGGSRWGNKFGGGHRWSNKFGGSRWGNKFGGHRWGNKFGGSRWGYRSYRGGGGKFR